MSISATVSGVGGEREGTFLDADLSGADFWPFRCYLKMLVFDVDIPWGEMELGTLSRGILFHVPYFQHVRGVVRERRRPGGDPSGFNSANSNLDWPNYCLSLFMYAPSSGP
jgi:hypothetical protein